MSAFTEPRSQLSPSTQQVQQRPILPTFFPTGCHCHNLPAMPLPASLLPPMPGPRPSAALCTGCSEIPVLARPARPPSPAWYVCVCVGRCDVSVPVDASLAFGLAAVCYAVASALFRPLFCLHSRFRFLMRMWGVARPAAFVCNVLCSVPVSLCVLGDVMFRCLSMCSLLSGSHFTHTPHPHHTTATHHTQSSPLISLPPRLALAHASLRWHTVVLCLWMHFVLDQVYPNYPKLNHPYQVRPS